LQILQALSKKSFLPLIERLSQNMCKAPLVINFCGSNRGTNLI
jgi:hypothetical protein